MTEKPFNLMGHDLFGEPIAQKKSGELSKRFEFPPFSVLDARQGVWQERKAAWVGLGIRGEVGRGGNLLTISDQCETYRQSHAAYTACRPHQSRDSRPGRDGGEYSGGDAWLASGKETGTSVFDPALCEVCYRWFCPPSGQIVDPFAGGSVRGIVATLLGFKYWGCELRAEQVAANEKQADEICGENRPVWVCGDSLDEVHAAPDADFVFSCPPYGDLERYSDDARDLSTMEYHTFLPTYKTILLRTCKRLKPNRFACFVVGDFRDKRSGAYRGFVADTVNAMRDIGLALYNDAILLTAVGSLPIRVGKQFTASRKLGKTHQNVLVFVKGDAFKASKDICSME